MDNKKIFAGVMILLVLGVASLAMLRGGGDVVEDTKYDVFAQCIKDSGATFYGAFWCSHCQAQKKMFGSSAKLLPYVECSQASGQGQLQVCIDKNIEGYPTWEFADLSRLSGEVSLEVLSEKTACPLPGDALTELSLELPEELPTE